MRQNTSFEPGGAARYAVFVWLTSGRGGSASLHLTTKPASFPATFTVCQPSGKARCQVGGLNGGQRAELQVQVVVPAKAKNGTVVGLTVHASSAQAVAPGTATASAGFSVTVPGSTPVPTPPVGTNVPLPPVPGGGVPGFPPGPVPTLPNPGSVFPTISPSASAPGTDPHKSGGSVQVTDVSASFPLAARLIGGQLIGLVILAAAVTITLVRLSLRKQRQSPAESDPAEPTATSAS